MFFAIFGAEIHRCKKFNFVYYICRQNNNSKEKQYIKPDSSNSWYIAIKKLVYKYDFSDIIQFLENNSKQMMLPIAIKHKSVTETLLNVVLISMLSLFNDRKVTC